MSSQSGGICTCNDAMGQDGCFVHRRSKRVAERAMTSRERAKAWMLERCPAEATGTRFGTEDVDSGDTDTETGVACDCLDALTKLLDDVEADLVARLSFSERTSLAALDVVAQARNVSPRICGAAGVLAEKVKAYDTVVVQAPQPLRTRS